VLAPSVLRLLRFEALACSVSYLPTQTGVLPGQLSTARMRRESRHMGWRARGMPVTMPCKRHQGALTRCRAHVLLCLAC
jgi:hypothetical protein